MMIIQKLINGFIHHLAKTYPEYEWSTMRMKSMTRVVRENTRTHERIAYCFIDDNGNIRKPDGWNHQKGIRGNVTDPHISTYSADRISEY